MLSGLIQSGFQITGTWPIRTELKSRSVAMGTNALSTSIVLACRPRPAEAKMATRRAFLQALRRELPESLDLMVQNHLSPADLDQAMIGPGMSIFSRYTQVIEADGSPMSVRGALTLINQVLAELRHEEDTEYDADTRWAIRWFEMHGFKAADYDQAEVISKAQNTSVQGLVEAGIIEAKGGQVRLLQRHEYPRNWSPVTDQRFTLWESLQHFVLAFERGGEQEAARLLFDLQHRADHLHRGDIPRLHRNMLIFLAMDATFIERLKEQTKLFLAWRKIKEKKEQYNLDTHQKAQVNQNFDHLDNTVNQLLESAYKWVLVPKKGEQKSVEWSAYLLGGGYNCIAKASRKLTYEEELIIEWSPARLSEELKEWIWQNHSDVSLQKIWSYYTQYLYLSRLRDQEVLRQAIIAGLASQDYFGYAQAREENGRYQGFIYHELGARVSIDQQSRLIHPNVAEAISSQRREEEKQKQQTAATSLEVKKPAREEFTQPSPKPKLVQKRYQRMNGIASIPPERVMFHVNQLWEEIIQLLVKVDQTELDIRVDLEVKAPAGLPEHVVRAVRENAHQLGVRIEFYEE